MNESGCHLVRCCPIILSIMHLTGNHIALAFNTKEGELVFKVAQSILVFGCPSCPLSSVLPYHFLELIAKSSSYIDPKCT